MNSVVMDNVILGDECIVGALSFIKADQQIPARSLLVGNPAKIIKQVSDDMIKWKTDGTKIYQQLAQDMRTEWKSCVPLREGNKEGEKVDFDYKTWNETKEE
jgi:carbonic anhydrase/acetyltransferase-like protein (isoleucine patch superfamily)